MLDRVEHRPDGVEVREQRLQDLLLLHDLGGEAARERLAVFLHQVDEHHAQPDLDVDEADEAQHVDRRDDRQRVGDTGILRQQRLW